MLNQTFALFKLFARLSLTRVIWGKLELITNQPPTCRVMIMTFSTMCIFDLLLYLHYYTHNYSTLLIPLTNNLGQIQGK